MVAANSRYQKILSFTLTTKINGFTSSPSNQKVKLAITYSSTTMFHNFLFFCNLLIVHAADSSPVPLTPDYGGPVVSYADGVFDLRFNRFVTVMEGR